MEKRRYIKQEWRKNWKYLQEKLPITTGWITDGVSDDITNKEVTEEIMGLLDKAREEGREEVINELNDLDDVENNDEFRQYKVWAKYLIEQLSKLKDNK